MNPLKTFGVVSFVLIIITVLLVLLGTGVVAFLDNGLLIGSYMFVYTDDGCESGANDIVRLGQHTIVYVLNTCAQ